MSKKTQEQLLQLAVDYAKARYKHTLSALVSSKKAAELSLELEMRKAVMLDAIANEEGPDNKPIYSNDAKRSAELMRRCREDVDYCHDEANRDQLRNESRLQEIEAEYYRDLLKITLAFAGNGNV